MINMIGNDVLIVKRSEDERIGTFQLYIGTDVENGFWIEENNLDDAIEVLQKAKELLVQRELYPFEKCTDKWIAKDGKEMNVEDMTTNHIKNAINMVKRICNEEKLVSSDYEIVARLNDELRER